MLLQILVPTFNRVDLLVNHLNVILAGITQYNLQKKISLIIIDNKSTDNTVPKVEKLILKAKKQLENGHLAVAVIEVQKHSEKIPKIEQTYSAGAVCLALLNAASAAGWGANWLTGWHVHDKEFIKNGLGLKDNESVAGLIYIGTPSITPPERPRPNLDEIVEWQ